MTSITVKDGNNTLQTLTEPSFGAHGGLVVEGVASGTVIPISGAVSDAGFSTATAHLVTAITDTTVTAITAAPTAGQKRVMVDFWITTNTAQNITIKEETSGTVMHGPIYLPANCVFQATIRATPLSKLATADKKYTATCSSGSHLTTIETWSYSEA